MSSGNVRKGITQAKFNEDQIGIFIAEILLISGVVGWFYKDWYVFAGVLFGLISIMYIPYLNILLAVVLSLAWGGIGYVIGKMMSQEAAYVIGGILFLAGMGSHLGAIEWAKDVSDTKDRNI